MDAVFGIQRTAICFYVGITRPGRQLQPLRPDHSPVFHPIHLCIGAQRLRYRPQGDIGSVLMDIAAAGVHRCAVDPQRAGGRRLSVGHQSRTQCHGQYQLFHGSTTFLCFVTRL